jgi:hypothetical protein
MNTTKEHNKMALQLNINSGEFIFAVEIPDTSPPYAPSGDEYEQFWEYNHPSTNDVFVTPQDQQQYADLMDGELIEEQWFEEA